MSTLYPANPIASYPIQLSKNSRPTLESALASDLSEATAHPSARSITKNCFPSFRTRQAGGADRVRTDDLRLARAALSQLSYSPGSTFRGDQSGLTMVGLGRFELPTSRLSGVRSNQLSYRPREGKPVPWKLGRGQRYSRTIDLGFCQAFHPLRLQTGFLRKEVIQPQVLLQLPCYDFTPIAEHTMDGCFPEGLAHRLPVQPTFVM